MKKDFWIKVLYVIVIMAVSLALVYVALKETVPDLIPLLEDGDVNEIKNYLRSSGTLKGVLCTALLQMVQVWSLFISGIPIQVAAGCVYGLFPAFVLCHLASVAAHFIALIVWREMGEELEKWMPMGANKKGKLDTFLDSKAPPFYIVILACMIPILPNGVIPLLASKMEISVPKYVLSVWAGSILNVFLCCAAGNRIIRGDWLMACLFILILAVLFALLWVFRNRILDLSHRLAQKRQKGRTE